MASETEGLPIIDFTKKDLKPGTLDWKSVRSQVHKALEEYGYFEAIYDKIPLEILKEVLNGMEEFFELPFETKQGIVRVGDILGYTGRNPLIPLFQNLAINDAHIFENLEKLTNQAWPQGNPNFSKTMHTYTILLMEFEQTLKRMVFESLGLDKYVDEFMDSTKYSYRLRLMKYDGPGTSEKQIGTPTHTDKNVLTILYQNHVGGLEVKTKQGKWISYKPLNLKSFHIVAGDSLHAWSNGRLYSPSHNVMSSGHETRYSFGLFSAIRPGYIINAPEELIDEEHPRLFKPFDYGEYLEFYYRDPSEKLDFALKSYCGI